MTTRRDVLASIPAIGTVFALGGGTLAGAGSARAQSAFFGPPELIVPGGQQILTLTDGSVTHFDAVTNEPFFLADWQTFRATGETANNTTLAYPLRIDAAQPDFVFNGGRFYGNIGESVDWDDFYEGGRFTLAETHPRFNSALLLPRNGVAGTFNDQVFGIRDDLDSGYVDGFRLAQAGNCTINRPRVWIGRDDWLEADDANNMVHTINDGYFENLFVWISGSGEIPDTVFHANRCLVHFRRWPFRGQVTHGPFLKVDSPTSSPIFRFDDVCFVIDHRNTLDNNRVKSALSRTRAENGCRLLVLGAAHEDRELVQMFQNAGFSVLEDGNDGAATEEWFKRKAAFLD
jgi:hypothetical protein